MIGSLCTGYGGLDLAVGAFLNMKTAWVCENDPDASRILARRFPGVPNHGDLKTTDWHEVTPVDVLTAGYPCQPFSVAGRRLGEADERHLWPHIADAIRVLRPRLVVLENVAGHLRLGFADVLADLAALGFDAGWGIVRASDAGAPHQRARLFVVAADTRLVPRDARRVAAPRQTRSGWALDHAAGRDRTPATDPAHERRGRHIPAESSSEQGQPGDARLPLTPSSHPSGDGWHERRPESARVIGGRNAAIGGDAAPAGRDGDVDASTAIAGPIQDLRDVRHAIDQEAVRETVRGPVSFPAAPSLLSGLREYQNGCDEGHSPLARAKTEAGQMLGMRGDDRSARSSHRPRPHEQSADEPDDAVLQLSPQAALARGSRTEDGIREEGLGDCGCALWGKYAPAIHRWEMVLDRVAPSPTEPNRKGQPRLSARAVEWLMGLPEGWVTDVGISRNAQLKALGNGVVPQQASLALSLLAEQHIRKAA